MSSVRPTCGGVAAFGFGGASWAASADFAFTGGTGVTGVYVFG
jgi:hypothetical protein